jgi:hypothetical protein
MWSSRVRSSGGRVRLFVAKPSEPSERAARAHLRDADGGAAVGVAELGSTWSPPATPPALSSARPMSDRHSSSATQARSQSCRSISRPWHWNERGAATCPARDN